MEDAFDMPPHHVGHYDKAVIEKIAKEIDMTVINIVEQKESFPAGYYKERFGVFYHLLSSLLYLRFIKNRKVGHTILAILKKS
ncbi:MAG: hypothetical protein Q4G13_00565 [Moraxella sp.]|nr:hypothetical protein [Moraxella sp.]